MKKPVVLAILDGWGVNNHENEVNGIRIAQPKNFLKYKEEYEYTELRADGEFVGLPEGQFGNSEVGHLNIGAGRVVYQLLPKISKEIREGKILENKVLNDVMNYTKTNDKKLHIIGLMSDGGVHAHIEHILGLVNMAHKKGITKIYIHAITDGRDTSTTGGLKYIEYANNELEKIGAGDIVTVVGRYYAMDRDKNWERTEKAYNAIVAGNGTKVQDLIEEIRKSYKDGITDEFILPIIKETNEDTRIGREDGVIFANFRPDRARQLTRAIVDKDFNGFEREKYLNTNFVCMAQYDITIDAPVAYPPEEIVNGFGEVVAKHGLVQIRTAETEKYAHVTFFFNGGKEEPYEGEIRLLSHSPKVATYDLKPEMSAYEVKDNLIKELERGNVDTVILNFANPDMVGHTGVVEAVVKACIAVDECLGEIVDKVLEMDGDVLVTADHGNADLMVNPETGEPHTAHTTNPVPFILVTKRNRHLKLRKDGKLADIAPTMLELLNIEKPKEMDGESLIIK